MVELTAEEVTNITTRENLFQMRRIESELLLNEKEAYFQSLLAKKELDPKKKYRLVGNELLEVAEKKKEETPLNGEES